MVTEQQLKEFERTGLLRVPDVLSRDEAGQVRADIWRHLTRVYGIDEHDHATWPAVGIPTFKGLSRSEAFEKIGVGAIPGALRDVMRSGWQAPKTWAANPMVTFPMPGTTWDVPSDGWHFDRPYDAVDRPGAPGVNVFVFVDQVRPRGAGTVVLTGSHRLVARHAAATSGTVHARELKAALRREDPWLADLFSPASQLSVPGQPDRIERFMHDGARVNAVDLRVVELTGEPGEAILMDARSLHTIAPNCLDTPRIMLNQLISR